MAEKDRRLTSSILIRVEPEVREILKKYDGKGFTVTLRKMAVDYAKMLKSKAIEEGRWTGI